MGLVQLARQRLGRPALQVVRVGQGRLERLDRRVGPVAVAGCWLFRCSALLVLRSIRRLLAWRIASSRLSRVAVAVAVLLV